MLLCDKKYIGYIYKTTNNINGKIYIGQHQREEFDKKYYGSGVILYNVMKKYGKENFKVEILYWSKSLKRLNDAEILFIIQAFDSANREVGYNLSFGGKASMKGRKHTEESKKKMSKFQKGKLVSDETKKKQSDSRKGKKHTPEWCKKIGLSNLGKHNKTLSEETKRKISESQKGKIVSEETKRKHSIISMGNKSNLGRKRSEETKRKISLSNKLRWDTGQRKDIERKKK
jgi:group I intron endonuclease